MFEGGTAIFKVCPIAYGPETLHKTSDGLGKMFEGDSAYMSAESPSNISPNPSKVVCKVSGP